MKYEEMLALKKGDIVIADKCISEQPPELLGTMRIVEEIQDPEISGYQAYMVDSEDWCWGHDEIRFLTEEEK